MDYAWPWPGIAAGHALQADVPVVQNAQCGEQLGAEEAVLPPARRQGGQGLDHPEAAGILFRGSRWPQGSPRPSRSAGRSAASKAERAAEALDAFLRDRPAALATPDLRPASANRGYGIRCAIGARSIGPTITASISPTTTSMISPVAGNEVSIHRFFDKTDGTHFFTASEAADISATRTDLSYAGIELTGYDSASASPSSKAVFRFFDTMDGMHFFTASTSERDSLLAASSSNMTFEAPRLRGCGASSRPQRRIPLFDPVLGTHLFTESASEKASILATRPDLVSEGIALDAPTWTDAVRERAPTRPRISD